MAANFDTNAQVQQVIQAERAWLKAHLDLDVAMLDHLMADEYLQVSSQGELVPKAQVLESFHRGTRHWESAESDDYIIRVYGDAAIVFGRWRAKGVNAGTAFDYRGRYVSVWIYRDIRWQMASDQMTVMPDGAKA